MRPPARFRDPVLFSFAPGFAAGMPRSPSKSHSPHLHAAGQPIAQERRREARHRDAAGLGGVVERRDEIALQAGRVVAGRWHAVLLSEFGIPRRNRRGGGAGFSERLKLPPIRL